MPVLKKSLKPYQLYAALPASLSTARVVIASLSPIIAVSILSLCLSACGEFAYKRGANASDLENIKKTCASKGGNAASIEKCMEDNGWAVQRFNETDSITGEPLLAEASVSNDNRNMGPAEKTYSKTTPPTTNSSNPDGAALPGSNLQDASAEKAVVKKPADPMDTFKVSSWWKLGSGGESLKTAINECVSTLGEAHKPNDATQMVTRGLIVCMGGKGWRGLRAK